MCVFTKARAQRPTGSLGYTSYNVLLMLRMHTAHLLLFLNAVAVVSVEKTVLIPECSEY